MSLKKVFDQLESKFLVSKGATIRDRMVKPLLLASDSYDRISSFFSPYLIKTIFFELSTCLTRGGKIRIVIGVHESDKLVPILDDIYNNEHDEKFKNAVKKIIESNIEECIEVLEEDDNIYPVLSQMVQQDFLTFKIGAVKEDYSKYIQTGLWPKDDSTFHPKISIFKERNDCVILHGSINETYKGYDSNIENGTCISSWDNEKLVGEFQQKFEEIWCGNHSDITTLDFNQEIKSIALKILNSSKTYNEFNNKSLIDIYQIRNLLSNSPIYRSFFYKNVRLLPHQQAIHRIALSRWPIKAIIADEVGLGKTIEAGSILEYLKHFTNVKRSAILVPASLRYQWQSELYNLFGLEFYIYEPSSKSLVFKPNNKLLDEIKNVSPRDFYNHRIGNIIFSWHFLRTRNQEGNYKLSVKDQIDLIIVDEVHAARLKRNNDDYEETQLYSLLKTILPSIKHSLLLTATPQQTNQLDYYGLLKLFVDCEEFDNTSLDRIARLNLDQSISLQNKLMAVEEMKALQTKISSIPEFTFDADDPASMLECYNEPKYLNNHPSTIFTLRNTRDHLKEIGYTFPDVNLYSKAINFDSSQKRVFDLVDDYIENELFRFEKDYLDQGGYGFVKVIYAQRIVSSFNACYDTLSCRKNKLENLLEEGASENTSFIEVDDIEDELTHIQESIELEDHMRGAINREIRYIKEILSNFERTIFNEKEIFDPKIEKALEIIDKHLSREEQVIVFSRFTSTTEFIVNRLKIRSDLKFGRFQGDKIQLIQGKKSLDLTRKEISRKFKNRDFELIICSDAASEGLNLQSANVLLNIDVPWNPGRLLQRFGRIDRFGQKKSEIFFYNFFYPGTIEDRMYGRLHNRNEDFRTLLGSTPDITSNTHIEEMIDSELIEDNLNTPKYLNSLIKYSKKNKNGIHVKILDFLNNHPDVTIQDKILKVHKTSFEYSIDPLDNNYLDLNHPIFEEFEHKIKNSIIPLYVLSNTKKQPLFLCLLIKDMVLPLVQYSTLLNYLINDKIDVNKLKSYSSISLHKTLQKVLDDNSEFFINHNLIKFSTETVELYKELTLQEVGKISI